MKEFLKRGVTKSIEELERELHVAAQGLEYEKAIELRDLLRRLRGLETAIIMPSQYVDNPNLMEDIYIKRQQEIVKILELENSPEIRIECYDISNIQGDWATGSMVVSEGGQIKKQEYRRFRIKYTKGITDYGMMTEILKRRVKREWHMPTFFLIDGGKGQVGVVEKAIKGTVFGTLPVIGIFKPNDYLLIKKEDTWKIIKPNRDNLGHLHLRELRDEAHRFAKGYHKQLRNAVL